MPTTPVLFLISNSFIKKWLNVLRIYNILSNFTLPLLHYLLVIVALYTFRKGCFDVQLYLWELCYNENWNRPRTGAAIAWREPIAFGCRRMLIGDANDFQEFCFQYYGLILDSYSCSMVRRARENDAEKRKVSESRACWWKWKKTLKETW